MKMLDVILYTYKPLTTAEMADLKRVGLRVVATLGNQVYRLRGISDASLADLRVLNYVMNVSEFKPEEKLDAALKKKIKIVMTAPKKIATKAGAGTTAEQSLKVLVSLDPHVDSSETISALKQIGKVKESSMRRALVEVKTSKIKEIALLSGVLAVETEPVNRVANNIARVLTGVSPIADNLGLDGSGEIVGVADTGLDTGTNDVALLADFVGRVVNIRATVNKAAYGVADGADLNNHGTHVSGSILGDGANSNGNLAGMAPSAQLTILSMGPDNSGNLNVPADLTTGIFTDAYNDGARLHNNSWGDPAHPSDYTAQTEDVDQFVRDNPDMLILAAAGNEGPNASTIRPPGTAKNCVTVGACESVRPLPAAITLNPNLQDHDFNPNNADVNIPLQLNNFDQRADNVEHIAEFSSRGPTDDNRIKPDIVASGSWILSCRSSVSIADVGLDGIPHAWLGVPPPYADDADGVPTHAEAVGRGLPGAPFFGTWNQNTPAPPPGSGPNCQQNYYYNSGTSMATPITTGVSALLRQYLRQRRGIENPSAALLKAMLINGATVPAGQSNTPDNDRGFGWLNLDNTLTPAPTGRQAYSDDVDLAIGPPAADGTLEVRRFSVQLAATGHPFRVTLTWTDEPGSGVQNKLYLRVIAPDGTVHDGDVTAFPTVSNNVQRVHIETPIAGTYTIEVHGVEVLFGIDAHAPQIRQDFALAVINGIGFSPEPVDICQVIDKSGSMGYYGYIDPVRERAKQLVDMLRINDRTGAVAFNGTASLIHPVVPIDGLPTQEAIKMGIDGIMAGGVTSIGAGLELGQAQLTAGGDASHPQAMVLLSDGHENTPPWVGSGVTDSPPSSYTGSDLTEILPTIPAETKIYTVSLGDQSDQVLLQDIANLRGGVFYAIHSPTEIGKLHEIYVHLQALTGGEEVIAADSDSVDGLNLRQYGSTSAGAAEVGPDIVDGAVLAELKGLFSRGTIFSQLKSVEGIFPKRVHNIPVDESLDLLTMMVSWHNPGRPVSLTLISPSYSTIRAGSPLYINRTGSSYQFFRIEKPEVGNWLMIVSALGQESGSVGDSHPYTWGAYGKSPLGIAYRLPKKVLGLKKLRLEVNLVQKQKVARTMRIYGFVNVPRQTIGNLIGKYKPLLAKIELPLKLDRPKMDPNLFKLAALDMQMVDKGKGSIFRTQRRFLSFTKNNRYADSIAMGVPGLYTIKLTATGRSREGYVYQRQAYFDVFI